MKIVKFFGGLGNQMFQYCFYMSIKNNYRNEEVLADLSHYNQKNSWTYNLQNIFDIKIPTAKSTDLKKLTRYSSNQLFKKIKNRFFQKKDSEFQEINPKGFDFKVFKQFKDTHFNGHWMNEMYFTEIEESVKSSFEFPDFESKKNIETYEIIKKTSSVGIHLRRGDYIKNNHLLLDETYYINSINKIKEITNSDLVFFIFSDDINYCKHIFNEVGKKNKIIYVNHNHGDDSFRDMQLMSKCDHNILANSTFSWWASWLNKNPNKITLISDLWSIESNHEKGHILEKWIKIK